MRKFVTNSAAVRRNMSLQSYTLNTTTPLVNQVLLTWLTKSFVYFKATDAERTALGLQKPQGIGYGIGLAFAIFAMQGTSFIGHFVNVNVHST